MFCETVNLKKVVIDTTTFFNPCLFTVASLDFCMIVEY